MSQELSTLQKIYRYYLNREPDIEAISTYIPLLENNLEEGASTVQKDIINSIEYTTNISLLIPKDPSFGKEYDDLVHRGKESIRNLKIVFLGLARNLEKVLESSINRLVQLGGLAKDYKIVIFENDSIDNTKIILDKLSNSNHNISVLSECNHRPQFGTIKDIERTTALAEYRNKLKDYAVEHFPEYDFVIVTDLDFVDFSLHGVYNSFGWFDKFPNRISAIAGNSYEYKYVTSDTTQSLWNYDSWAFRYNWWTELPGLPSMTYNRMMWFGFFVMPVGLPIIPVNSAFGGMAIYKMDEFKLGTYDGTDCEHVRFHYSLKQNISNFQLVLNPSQIMLV